ncbi:MAG TPA: RluA family pseudouridine synthase [Chitinophagales bacterium]|nr:RluA family pseudouridine synthase [Chitinophagales bacterium]
MHPKPEILFEDEHMLVVNKPTGITVIPDRIHTDRETLQSILQKDYGRLFVVHRIDRGTSGVICFARTEEAHKNLSLQFQNHEVRKFYLAVVQGILKDKSGTIEVPIGENKSRPGIMTVDKRGKAALTLYKLEEQFKHAALLEVEIKTGRTHQVRVHMAFIGHPLLVDDVYGKSGAFYFSTIKKHYKPSGEEELPTIARLTLHAFKLSLTHPATKKEMLFEAPVPKDIQTLLKLLRKYDV